MKKNIILDLDNTLICAVEHEEYKRLSLPVSEYTTFDIDNVYKVFERPHLDDFLTFLFEHFNVYVWSAGTKNYVMSVVQNVFEKRKLIPKLVFFLYHCQLSEKHYSGLKDLDLFLKCTHLKKEDTYIVDDLSDVIHINPKNSFHIKEFDCLQEDAFSDRDLLRIKQELTKLL
jgi:TFIIF-interacting CTD phosphatase-like protein